MKTLESYDQIYPKWSTGIKRNLNRMAKNSATFLAARQELLPYLSVENLTDAPSLSPPFDIWERGGLDSDIRCVTNGYLDAAEVAGYTGKPDSICLAARAFEYAQLGIYAELEQCRRYELRFDRPSQVKMFMSDVRHLGTGCWLGKTDETIRLGRLLIQAYRNQWFIHPSYPIFSFMLSVVADYMKEPPLQLVGEAAENSLFKELLQHWATTDMALITRLTLAACNYHTHRCQPDKNREWYEFAYGGNGMLWPIEINLLFRLREISGLENPIIDHPLMNTTLGKLQAPQACESDDIMLKVRAKMRTEGFDEDAIFEAICGK